MSTAQIIRDAADHIEKVGLHKGNFFKGEQIDPTVPCCTLGALGIVTGALFSEESGVAERAIATVLDLPYDDQHKRPVAYWNDRPSQRKGKLVASLRRVADKLEATDG